MSVKLTRLAIGVMALPLLAACATKGYVRDQVSVARAELTDTINTKIEAERQERMSADEAIRADVASLRSALDSPQDSVAWVSETSEAASPTGTVGARWPVLTVTFDDARPALPKASTAATW